MQFDCLRNQLFKEGSAPFIRQLKQITITISEPCSEYASSKLQTCQTR